MVTWVLVATFLIFLPNLAMGYIVRGKTTMATSASFQSR